MAIVNGKQVINNMQIETSTGTVYWQEDEPLEPKEGDTWFKVVNGKATNSYNRENGEWVEVAFSSQIIAEELVGKIITGAEVNGAVINGGTINGSSFTGGEFINNFLIKESDFGEREGSTELQDGEITQDSIGWRLDNGVRTTKAYENHFKVVGGQIQMQSTAYEGDGVTEISNSSMIIAGGAIQLSLKDETGIYVGRLDARALTSTPWVTLQLGSAFAVKENNPPQYKIQYELDGTRTIQFRGQFGLKSGKMLKGASYYPFQVGSGTDVNGNTTVPITIKPDRTEFAYGAGQGTLGGRLAINLTPKVIYNPAEDTDYCALSSLSYSIE